MVPNLSKATDDLVSDVAVDGFKPSRFNNKGKDLAVDGHPVLLDRSDLTSQPYVLLLIIEGRFRACLESEKVEDYMGVCLESGSSTVRGSVFRSYLHAGDDPFELAKEAMKVVRAHLGTFRLLEEKTPPPIVDKFGWCTWDAFYLKVHPEGVWEGVLRLAEGGCPLRLMLIDDSWQSICHDEDDPSGGSEGMNRTSVGEQMPCRLIKFQENHKFNVVTSRCSPPASTSANDVAAEGNRTPRPAFAMSSGEFILDSGASCHATGDMDLLVYFTPEPQTGRSVCVANGSLLPILGHGYVRLRSVTLPGVLYVPGLAMNIVSVSKLGELDYSVTFTPTRCFVREACDGAVVGEGRRVNGLFQLDYLRVPLGRARCATNLRLGSE